MGLGVVPKRRSEPERVRIEAPRSSDRPCLTSQLSQVAGGSANGALKHGQHQIVFTLEAHRTASP